ncbi:DUF1801 domain-containing protein [Dokdonella immobilis]|nr:DUF1801 domain-containing protein [Dokdonella immobilis]
MPAAAKPKVAHSTPADSSAAVDAFMAELVHPHKSEIQALRRLMLEVDPSVQEGIKWNAPSFRTSEYFATTHLRAKSGLSVVLHLGAKVRQLPSGGVAIEDPTKLLKWLGKDRAMVEFASAEKFNDARAAFQAVLRQWVQYI